MALTAQIIKAADVLVGRPLCAVLGLLPRARQRPPLRSGPPDRVLVVRPGGIGDAVLFIPLLHELRRAWPGARVELLLERRNAGVLAGTGLVDRVLLYDRFPHDLLVALRGRYDVVIDTEQYHVLSAIVAFLSGAPRRVGFGTNVRRLLLTDPVAYDQHVYEVYSFLALAQTATGREPAWDRERPFVPLDPAAQRFAGEALAPLAGRRLVAIHPGASIPERRWPPQRYAAVARALADRGAGIVVLGGPGDEKAARVIRAALEPGTFVDLAGRSTLMQAAAAVARVAVYISADTGLLHLAYGVGTPTVHLFGPGVLSKWGPPGARFRSVAAAAPCSPCTVYGYTPPCCQGNVCMLRITPEAVTEEAWSQLGAGAA